MQPLAGVVVTRSRSHTAKLLLVEYRRSARSFNGRFFDVCSGMERD